MKKEITKNKNVTKRGRILMLVALGISAAALAAAVYIGAVSERATRETAERTAALFRYDFYESVQEMSVMLDGAPPDTAGAVRAAGRAEAYFSRAAVPDCEGLYPLLDAVCAMLGDVPETESGNVGAAAALTRRLSEAAETAVSGDGGYGLRQLLAAQDVVELISHGSRTAARSSPGFEALEYAGDGGEEAALKTARRYAGKNAVLRRGGGVSFPPSYVWLGDNIYVCVTSDGGNLLEFRFDRDIDLSRDIGCEGAAEKALKFVDEMKLRDRELLTMDASGTAATDGVYLFKWYREGGDGGNGADALISVGIHADTGSLRRFDAVEYYRTLPAG